MECAEKKLNTLRLSLMTHDFFKLKEEKQVAYL